MPTPTNTANFTPTTTTTNITTTTSQSLNEIINLSKVTCDNHENCSSRILSLDAYCCQSTNYCCNWFEYSTSYK